MARTNGKSEVELDVDHELPASDEEVHKLARRLGFEAAPGRSFQAELRCHRLRTRELFLSVLSREGGHGTGADEVGRLIDRSS